MMMLQDQKSFFVSDWRVSPTEGVLSRGNEVVHLEPKVAEVLVYLASHAGKVVTREELEREVWHGAVVGYDAVTSTVIKLRRALHDNSRQPQYVTTIPKRGYELIAPVRREETEAKFNASIGSTPEPTTIEAPISTPKFKSRFNALILSLLSVMILGLAGIFWPWQRSGTPTSTAPSTKIPSVIVLPFENLSSDPKQDYLADGMTDDLITDLSRTTNLRVLSNNTSYIYRGKHITPQEIGKALHIDYVLQGNIRSVGNAIRVNTQLVDARTGFNKWGEIYDRSTKEIFKVQHEITSGIVNALSLTLTNEEKQRLARKATSNLNAYGFFQEGLRLTKRYTKEDNQLAEEAYQRAIEIDPTYGRAYGALAYNLGVDYLRAWSDTPVETLNRALDMARHAVAIDDSIPQTYWALGWVYLQHKEYTRAEQATRKSIKIAPNFADGYGLLALIYNHEGKSEQAIENIQKGMQLNPYYTWDYPYNLGRAYYDLGHYDKAIAALEDAHQRNPNSLFATLYLVASYVRAGRQDDAEWLAQEIQANNSLITISHLKKIKLSVPKLLEPLLADLRKAGLPE